MSTWCYILLLWLLADKWWIWTRTDYYVNFPLYTPWRRQRTIWDIVMAWVITSSLNYVFTTYAPLLRTLHTLLHDRHTLHTLLRTLKPFQNLKFPKTIEDITNRPVFIQIKRQWWMFLRLQSFCHLFNLEVINFPVLCKKRSDKKHLTQQRLQLNLFKVWLYHNALQKC